MRRGVPLATLLLVSLPGIGRAQAPADDLLRRIQLLEEQVTSLKAEIAGLRAAVQQVPSTIPSPGPSQAAPAQAGPPLVVEAPPQTGTTSTAALPVYGQTTSKVFNPDIGMIGNFVGAAGESRGGSEAVAPFPSLTLQESEASFQAIVDPFARADFFLAIGEEGIEVEEGYVSFPALPGGLLVRAGKFRASFGRLNAFHNHTLPWVDRPLVMFNLLGGATEDPDTGIKDAGISVSRLVPAGNLFLEATAEVFRGDSGTLFQAARRRDVALLGRLRSYVDFTEQSNLEVGGSYVRGHNDAGPEFLTELYGADLTFRWRPLRRAIYRSFAGRAELIWSRRDDPLGPQRAFGAFVSADYQLARRWFVGGRYDWSERARETAIHDQGASAVLTFWPSEFSQIRGQYRRTVYGGQPAANELLFQALFTIGAHGAHPF